VRGGDTLNADDFPAPSEGFVLTQFLVVADQDRSRDFYQSILGGTVVLERDPVILRVANSWLILNVGGGPTDDKPSITLTTPENLDRTSAFVNVRVADIDRVYREWTAKGAEFLTPPIDHGREIRAYVRDPDGHLIEVGQATAIVRGATEGAREQQDKPDITRKLDAIRRAYQHQAKAPAPDIDQMNAEIKQGYVDEPPPT
jgi:lactoylglutathione lyase